MAGDWIKVQHVTPDKPEIDRLADALGVTPNEALGACIRFWIWADQQSVDGNALSVSKSLLDRVTLVTGFADALAEVGWIAGKSGEFTVPNFDRHNGNSAKNRALTSRRVKRHQKRKANAPSVSASSLLSSSLTTSPQEGGAGETKPANPIPESHMPMPANWRKLVKGQAPLIPRDLFEHADLCDAYGRWLQHLKDKGKPCTASAAETHIRILEKLGHDDAIQFLDQAIAGNWQGLRLDWFKPGGRTPGAGAGSSGRSAGQVPAADQRRADKAGREFPEPERPLRRL